MGPVFRPPALTLSGSLDQRVESLGALMMRPQDCWPAEVLNSPVIELRTASKQIALIADPAIAKDVLLNRGGAFTRSRLQNHFFQTSFGRNLLDNKTSQWQAIRPEMARPMASQRVLDRLPALQSAISDLIARWAQLPPGQPLDLKKHARIAAFDALWRSLFARKGHETRCDPQVLSAGERLHDAHERGFGVYVGETRRLAQWVLDRSRQDPGSLPQGIASDPPDVNTTLIFLDAGHDNVTSTLTWALWLIANRPGLQDAIRREWRAADRRNFDHADLPLTNAAVRETLRLFPPAAQALRDASGSMAFGGIEFGPKFLVCISIYAIHRSTLWWTDPALFLPERFLGNVCETNRAANMIPFSIGARACIGMLLAQLELVNFIGMIIDRFQLRPNPACPLRCQNEWILRPVGAAPIFIDPAR